DIDGYTVARSIRADPELAGVKLVALSGYGQAKDRVRAAEAGFDQHLTKPAASDAVIRAIDGESAHQLNPLLELLADRRVADVVGLVALRDRVQRVDDHPAVIEAGRQIRGLAVELELNLEAGLDRAEVDGARRGVGQADVHVQRPEHPDREAGDRLAAEVPDLQVVGDVLTAGRDVRQVVPVKAVLQVDVARGDRDRAAVDTVVVALVRLADLVGRIDDRPQPVIS